MEERTDKEIWRPIDYIGDGKTYEVSNYGRVRRTKNVRVRRIDGAVLIYRKGILQGHAAKGPITIEHNQYNRAKLVLRAFDPLADEPGHVDYLDGDNTNCRLDNIRWHMDQIQRASESDYKVTIPPSEELQQGDKVKIIRPEYNDPGCPWLEGMNEYIGKTMTIRYISKGGLIQMEEDYRRGDGANGEGYVWTKESCVPVENQVPIVPKRRWKIGDYVRSVTDYYADCPRGWCGYVEQTDEHGRPGMMQVTGFGEHYWVRQSDFVRIKTPTDPKVGDRVSIIDIGKMYPYNIDWLVEHNIDQETMCRFSFGHLPFVKSTKSVKCYVPAVIIAVDGETCLVESEEDRAVYLVDVTGLTGAKERKGQKK